MKRETLAKRSGGIPRGPALQGPAILSYGFRPFFLSAGIFAIASMTLWVGALTDGWPLGGDSYGALYWHGHELLFGYGGAEHKQCAPNACPQGPHSPVSAPCNAGA